MSGSLDLIDLYLRSTLVEHEGKVYAQKAGVCICSYLAPILSEISLLFVDKRVSQALAAIAPETLVLRYEDDYLIFHQACSDPHILKQAFADKSYELKFTSEVTKQDGLQYLDLRLRPSKTGICWSFQQRSSKPVIPVAQRHQLISNQPCHRHGSFAARAHLGFGVFGLNR